MLQNGSLNNIYLCEIDMYPIICIGGPTGAGKDTVVMEFLKRYPNYIRIPRTTTRKPRPHEIQGVHYYFLAETIFDAHAARGEICVIDHFCGHKYGIDMRKLSDGERSGKRIIGVFGVCAYGLCEVYEHGTLLVYITAPIALLRQRLMERGDSREQIEERVLAAAKQLRDEPPRFDYVIENTRSVTSAVNELNRVISLATRSIA